MMPPFVVADFLALYPQFSCFTAAQIENIYTYEALIDGSKVIACFRDTNYKYQWSWRVLAHILECYKLGLNGRTSQATEGSVSGSFANIDTVDANFWNKTAYGQACWKILQNRGGATYYPTAGRRKGGRIWG